MVHLLCKNYGWKLEYVLELTRGQINVLTKGMEELADLKTEVAGDVRTGKGRGRWVTYDKKGNKTQHEEKSANDIFALASMPGFALTERAKIALNKIIKQRAEAAKDATNSR